MTIPALSDTELLDQARTGDEGAFTELYVRHHAATLRMARTYRRFDDPGALVSATFERALRALRRGEGPTTSFRAYLYVTLRRLAVERAEATPEASLDDVPASVTAVAATARTQAGGERAVIDDAFDGLPDRWQVVVWHTAVEGRPGPDLAEALDVTPGAAEALAFRAREKLRQSYLQAHGRITPAPDHEPFRSQLGAYARNTLPRADRDAVRKHLGRCDGCTALLAEIENVDRTLARAMLPVFALVGGGKVAEILAAAAAAGAGGRKSVLGRLRTAAAPLGSTAAIAAVVGGVVGMGSMVAREDAGPLDSAADAADIGPLEVDDMDGRSSGRGFDDGGSLFGDDDYPLSPFDDEFDTYDDDYGGLGGKYDDFGDEYDDFGDGLGNGLGDGHRPSRSGRPPGSGIGSNLSPTNPSPTSPPPASPPPAAPPPAAPPPAAPPPTSPPPTSPPPTSPPPTNPPPAPAPLTFTASSWQPAADDATGTLHFEIGELNAPSSPGQGTPAATSVTMQVTLTGAARFAATGQPPGCTPAGATMTCTFPQPAPGQAGPSFDLAVTLGAPPADGTPGPVATAAIVRDGTVEATRQITLHRYASGLVMGATTWRPGAGVFEVVLDNRHPWPVEGLSLAIELQGGAAPAAGAAQPPGCTAERGPGDAWVIACVVSLPADDSLVLSFPVTVDGQGDEARATVQAGATTLQGMWTPLSAPG